MVLEDVPDRTTVVGIPARTANDYDEQRLDELNQDSNAFRPYGQSPGLSDPIDETINLLIKKLIRSRKSLV